MQSPPDFNEKQIRTEMDNNNKDESIGMRCREIDSNYLVTSDAGNWCFLDKNEFEQIGKNNVSVDLKKKLQGKNILLDDKNKEQIVMQYRRKYRHLFQGTSLHIIVPTLRCNQACVYCHASVKHQNTDGFDMTYETAEKAVDFIFQSPSKKITIEFQGGEPLLRFDIIKKIIDYSNKLNSDKKKELRFALVTNLILMDNEKLDYCIKNNIGICTSLDGPEKIHDKNRGQYTPLIDKIKWVREELEKKGKKLNALMVATKHSLGNHKEIIDEYVRLGFDYIQLKSLNPLGFAKQRWGEIVISAEEYIDFWRKSMNYIIELNNDKEGIIYESMTKVILERIFGFNSESIFLDLLSPCGAAIGQLVYNYDGSVFSCDEARMLDDDMFKLGNVFDDNYKGVICSDKCSALVASSVNDIYFCDLCAYKPYCGVCPVCNYALYGNVIPKLPEDFRCKVNKAIFDYIFTKVNDQKTKEIFVNWLEN